MDYPVIISIIREVSVRKGAAGKIINETFV